MNKKIEFKIPGGYLDAIFEKQGDNSWKFSIYNPSNRKEVTVEENMETKTVRQVIILMMGQDFIDEYKRKLW